jgi:hypothetical protein
VTAISSLMDRLLDLSKNSIQYGNSMCPSMIRKLKVIVYIRKVFLLSKWGSPIPFPTGGACVLSVIRFQDGGQRSAVVSAEARI